MTSNDPNLGQVYLTVTSTVHQASDFNSKPFETAFDLDDQRFDKQELLGKISDVHCSTQPTNFNISRTIETPIQANDENFDFSPRDGLGHYFDQGEPMAVNLLIAQLPSKKFTSSVSGSLASGINPDSKFSPSIEKEELLKNKAKSANLSMLKLTLQAADFETGPAEAALKDTKPVSLSAIANIPPKSSSKPIIPKRRSRWIEINRLEEASENDSMYVSTKVIKLDESNRQLEDQDAYNPDMTINPLDFMGVDTEQRKVAQCFMPKSLQSSALNEENGLDDQIQEEMEIPYSSDEEGIEEMEQSIPESFD